MCCGAGTGHSVILIQAKGNVSGHSYTSLPPTVSPPVSSLCPGRVEEHWARLGKEGSWFRSEGIRAAPPVFSSIGLLRRERFHCRAQPDGWPPTSPQPVPLQAGVPGGKEARHLSSQPIKKHKELGQGQEMGPAQQQL